MGEKCTGRQLKKKNAREFDILDSETYYKITVVKQVISTE